MAQPEGGGGKKERAGESPPKERLQFRQLVMGNPNYFGNLEGSSFEPVVSFASKTTYEELTCVGFNPDLDLLEGTVLIKQSTGYGGDLCQDGSREYVRFFVDYGGGWEDAGLTSFTAFDLPPTTDCAGDPDKPLVYAVSLEIDPKREFCGKPVLPNVRAILSWELAPPAGDPTWTPPWGNVVEQHVQIKPRGWWWSDLFEVAGVDLAKVKLPPMFKEIDPEPIPLPDPPPLRLAEAVKRYAKSSDASDRGGSVDPERFLLPYLKMAPSGAFMEQQTIADLAAQVGDLEIDWGAILGALDQTNADVSYEEIECLGLDNNVERLVATFRVKRPFGYSGELCEAGSTEHVAFWADWEDTCEWTYLGTVAINVHDIPSIPSDGLAYSAMIPVTLDPYRRSCKEPRIARVRAVLSWETPPSTTDPDALTAWGNRLDAHVQIRPGDPLTPGLPHITALGGIGVQGIDVGGSGLTWPGAIFAFTGDSADPWDATRQCPFGGRVVVQGPPVGDSRYRVRVRSATTLAESVVATPFPTLTVGGNTVWRYPDAEGCFPYLDTWNNMNNVLGHWMSTGDDLWEIRVEIVEPAPGTSILGVTAWHRIQLDNTRPERKPPLGTLTPPTVDISIDGGGDCKDFSAGTLIQGHFVARDQYFGAYSITTMPTSMLPNATSPSSGLTQTPPSPGAPWTLDTEGMKPCGYVVVVHAWDRSIVNSTPGHHNHNYADVGFCLRG